MSQEFKTNCKYLSVEEHYFPKHSIQSWGQLEHRCFLELLMRNFAMSIPAAKHKPCVESENIPSHRDRPSRMLWGRVSSSCCCYRWTFLSVSINYWQTFGCLPDSSLSLFFFFFISREYDSLLWSISLHPVHLGGQAEEAASDLGTLCSFFLFCAYFFRAELSRYIIKQKRTTLSGAVTCVHQVVWTEKNN